MMVNVQIYNHFPSYSRYFCLLHNSTPSTATPDLQWRDTLRGSIFTAAEGDHPQRSAWFGGARRLFAVVRLYGR